MVILLHSAGAEAQDIFNTFKFPGGYNDAKNNLDQVLQKFRTYCEPRKAIVFERYKFWQKNQREGVTFGLWTTKLPLLLKSCMMIKQTPTVEIVLCSVYCRTL